MPQISPQNGPQTGPRVLLVNDDGIDAPGLVLLEKTVRQFTDDIWVVAPDEERSGAGHSISTTLPIRIKQRDERHFCSQGHADRLRVAGDL